MSRSFESRLAILEGCRNPLRQYVIHVSSPRTKEEEEAIANATGPIVIVPHPCNTVDEWLAQCSPLAVLQ